MVRTYGVTALLPHRDRASAAWVGWGLPVAIEIRDHVQQSASSMCARVIRPAAGVQRSQVMQPASYMVCKGHTWCAKVMQSVQRSCKVCKGHRSCNPHHTWKGHAASCMDRPCGHRRICKACVFAVFGVRGMRECNVDGPLDNSPMNGGFAGANWTHRGITNAQ